MDENGIDQCGYAKNQGDIGDIGDVGPLRRFPVQSQSFPVKKQGWKQSFPELMSQNYNDHADKKHWQAKVACYRGRTFNKSIGAPHKKS